MPMHAGDRAARLRQASSRGAPPPQVARAVQNALSRGADRQQSRPLADVNTPFGSQSSPHRSVAIAPARRAHTVANTNSLMRQVFCQAYQQSDLVLHREAAHRYFSTYFERHPSSVVIWTCTNAEMDTFVMHRDLNFRGDATATLLPIWSEQLTLPSPTLTRIPLREYRRATWSGVHSSNFMVEDGTSTNASATHTGTSHRSVSAPQQRLAIEDVPGKEPSQGDVPTDASLDDVVAAIVEATSVGHKKKKKPSKRKGKGTHTAEPKGNVNETIIEGLSKLSSSEPVPAASLCAVVADNAFETRLPSPTPNAPEDDNDGKDTLSIALDIAAHPDTTSLEQLAYRSDLPLLGAVPAQQPDALESARRSVPISQSESQRNETAQTSSHRSEASPSLQVAVPPKAVTPAQVPAGDNALSLIDAAKESSGRSASPDTYKVRPARTSEPLSTTEPTPSRPAFVAASSSHPQYKDDTVPVRADRVYSRMVRSPHLPNSPASIHAKQHLVVPSAAHGEDCALSSNSHGDATPDPSLCSAASDNVSVATARPRKHPRNRKSNVATAAKPYRNAKTQDVGRDRTTTDLSAQASTSAASRKVPGSADTHPTAPLPKTQSGNSKRSKAAAKRAAREAAEAEQHGRRIAEAVAAAERARPDLPLVGLPAAEAASDEGSNASQRGLVTTTKRRLTTSLAPPQERSDSPRRSRPLSKTETEFSYVTALSLPPDQERDFVEGPGTTERGHLLDERGKLVTPSVSTRGSSKQTDMQRDETNTASLLGTEIDYEDAQEQTYTQSDCGGSRSASAPKPFVLLTDTRKQELLRSPETLCPAHLANPSNEGLRHMHSASSQQWDMTKPVEHSGASPDVSRDTVDEGDVERLQRISRTAAWVSDEHSKRQLVTTTVRGFGPKSHERTSGSCASDSSSISRLDLRISAQHSTRRGLAPPIEPPHVAATPATYLQCANNLCDLNNSTPSVAIRRFRALKAVLRSPAFKPVTLVPGDRRSFSMTGKFVDLHHLQSSPVRSAKFVLDVRHLPSFDQVHVPSSPETVRRAEGLTYLNLDARRLQDSPCNLDARRLQDSPCMDECKRYTTLTDGRDVAHSPRTRSASVPPYHRFPRPETGVNTGRVLPHTAPARPARLPDCSAGEVSLQDSIPTLRINIPSDHMDTTTPESTSSIWPTAPDSSMLEPLLLSPASNSDFSGSSIAPHTGYGGPHALDVANNLPQPNLLGLSAGNFDFDFSNSVPLSSPGFLPPFYSGDIDTTGGYASEVDSPRCQDQLAASEVRRTELFSWLQQFGTVSTEEAEAIGRFFDETERHYIELMGDESAKHQPTDKASLSTSLDSIILPASRHYRPRSSTGSRSAEPGSAIDTEATPRPLQPSGFASSGTQDNGCDLSSESQWARIEQSEHERCPRPRGLSSNGRGRGRGTPDRGLRGRGRGRGKLKGGPDRESFHASTAEDQSGFGRATGAPMWFPAASPEISPANIFAPNYSNPAQSDPAVASYSLGPGRAISTTMSAGDSCRPPIQLRSDGWFQTASRREATLHHCPDDNEQLAGRPPTTGVHDTVRSATYGEQAQQLAAAFLQQHGPTHADWDGLVAECAQVLRWNLSAIGVGHSTGQAAPTLAPNELVDAYRGVGVSQVDHKAPAPHGSIGVWNNASQTFMTSNEACHPNWLVYEHARQLIASHFGYSPLVSPMQQLPAGLLVPFAPPAQLRRSSVQSVGTDDCSTLPAEDTSASMAAQDGAAQWSNASAASFHQSGRNESSLRSFDNRSHRPAQRSDSSAAHASSDARSWDSRGAYGSNAASGRQAAYPPGSAAADSDPASVDARRALQSRSTVGAGATLPRSSSPSPTGSGFRYNSSRNPTIRNDRVQASSFKSFHRSESASQRREPRSWRSSDLQHGEHQHSTPSKAYPRRGDQNRSPVRPRGGFQRFGGVVHEDDSDTRTLAGEAACRVSPPGLRWASPRTGTGRRPDLRGAMHWS
ncbi:hypothetical protein CBOM_00192 [Ceraceosorus bombacis]|uniref:Uncharacterized protein n=1 Tax=Ceraceosorus bombacis TaxID=401625 RepID=A0A0P1BAH2_9BASI|nr:hypothetical protein CBOM_00192 [Ceraceosorus bombacis]